MDNAGIDINHSDGARKGRTNRPINEGQAVKIIVKIIQPSGGHLKISCCLLTGHVHRSSNVQCLGTNSSGRYRIPIKGVVPNESCGESGNLFEREE